MTLDERVARAKQQRQSAAYRLLPEPLYRRLIADPIDIEAIQMDRERALSRALTPLTDLQSHTWLVSTHPSRAAANGSAFHDTIPSQLAQLEQAQSRLADAVAATDESLLAATEHARIYQAQRAASTTIRRLKRVLRDRQDAAGQIQRANARAECVALHAQVTVDQWTGEPRAFDESLETVLANVHSAHTALVTATEQHPSHAFRATEVARATTLRSRLSTLESTLETVLTARTEHEAAISTTRIDLDQQCWATTHSSHRESTSPPRPTELEAHLDGLETTTTNLCEALEHADAHALGPRQYARCYETLRRAVDRAAALRQHRRLERRFRRLRHQLARLVRRLAPRLASDEYWETTDRRRSKLQLAVVDARLAALQLECASADDAPALDRIAALRSHLDAVATHRRLDVARARSIRERTRESVSRSLAGRETAYWQLHSRVESLLRLGPWSPDYSTPDALVGELDRFCERSTRSLESIRKEGTRPTEYGHLYGYVEMSRADRTALRDRWRAEETLNDVSETLARIEHEYEPYLAYDAYCPPDELQTVRDWLAEAHDALRALRDETAPRTQHTRDRIGAITRRVARYRSQFRVYNREFSRRRAHRQFVTAHRRYTALRSQLRPAMCNGDAIPDQVLANIDQHRDTAADLRAIIDGRLQQHLTPEFHDDASRLADQLDTLCRFAEEKHAFDDALAEQQRHGERLAGEVVPYLSFERFLTRPARSRLLGSIRDRQELLETWLDRTEFTLFSTNDIDTARDLVRDVLAYRARIADREAYNREFVARARDRHADVLTDIDAAGNDLTGEQARAVVRNGVYNLLVAGAGTGKTLTLTHRVQYLVEKRNVDPDRIAVVTLTKDAKKELNTRLEKLLGITDIDVRTLHSFGLSILAEDADGQIDVNADALSHETDRLVRDGANDEFLSHLRQFVHYDRTTTVKEDDFETRADYLAARANEPYTTIKGEEVESRAEQVIADFLFEHQVHYRHEEHAEWADTAPDKAGYRPDFHLPDEDIYIEHWGIGEDGQVPDWFEMSTEEYEAKRQWARAQFESVEFSLVETAHPQYEAGTLHEALERALTNHEVDLEQRSFEELVDAAYEYHNGEYRLKQRLEQFVHNAKTFSKTPADIRDAVTDALPKRRHFALCGAIVLEEYRSTLDETGQIDYHDMLSQAAALVTDHPDQYQRRYDHLLVDEFQDLSALGHDLIDSLVSLDPDSPRLFAVGDDWQSIYGFRGATVDQFVQFKETFGLPVRTALTLNYRCPGPVVFAGNQLINQNPAQIKKVVRPVGGADGPRPVVHTLNGKGRPNDKETRDQDYFRRLGRYVTSLVIECLEEGTSPDDILVLGRNTAGSRYFDRIKSALRRERIPYDLGKDRYRPQTTHAAVSPASGDGVELNTIHGSKGREAARVILVHIAEDRGGLPSDRDEHGLMRPARDIQIDHLSEERRLFYVGLTRASEECHITTRQGHRSQFIDEVDTWVEENPSLANLGPDGTRMMLTARVDQLWDSHPTQHQAGILEGPTGVVPFISWADDDPETVHEDHWYRFDGLRVNRTEQYGTQVVLDDRTVLTALSPGQVERLPN